MGSNFSFVGISAPGDRYIGENLISLASISPEDRRSGHLTARARKHHQPMQHGTVAECRIIEALSPAGPKADGGSFPPPENTCKLIVCGVFATLCNYFSAVIVRHKLFVPMSPYGNKGVSS